MRLVFMKESDIDRWGDAITTAIFTDGRPMTGAEFLAVGETPERIELFDGSLHVTPPPTLRHQVILQLLHSALDRGADAARLHVLAAVNVRLQPDRILIPDIVITAEIDMDEPVVDAADVHLVCEIISPSSSAVDKVLKMHYYATAGIRWYLLVEPGSGALHLYELLDTDYAERSVTREGDVLHLTEPVVASIDPADLLPPR